LLVDKHYPPLFWEYLKSFEISKISEFCYPLFVGSVVLALLVAVVLYLIVRIVAGQLRKKDAFKR